MHAPVRLLPGMLGMACHCQGQQVQQPAAAGAAEAEAGLGKMTVGCKEAGAEPSDASEPAIVRLLPVTLGRACHRRGQQSSRCSSNRRCIW